MEIMLVLGNYMNRGARGNASGFRIASLNKIVDTRSSITKNVTMLHYLLEMMEKKVCYTLLWWKRRSNPQAINATEK